MFSNCFNTLGGRFISGGDWNAKHTFWGSRLTTTRGRQLQASVITMNLRTISAGEPTYWPTDTNKIPDLLDFFITKGLSSSYLRAESCLDGSSDHTPVLLSVSTMVIEVERPLTLCNNHTDWESFREYLEDNINLKIALKCPEDIEEATKNITTLIQEACWKTTPLLTQKRGTTINWPIEIKNSVLEKRRLRRVWPLSRNATDRQAFNKAIQELRIFLKEWHDTTLEAKLESLTPTASSNYSLWKFTKSYNKPQVAKPPIRKSNDS